jgi:hypothetical protein
LAAALKAPMVQALGGSVYDYLLNSIGDGRAFAVMVALGVGVKLCCWLLFFLPDWRR